MSEAESETKTFIDDLVDSLSNGEFSGIERVPEPASTAPEARDEPNGETSEGEYVVTFGEDGSAYRAATQSDAMAKAVDHLVSEHDLIEKLSSFPCTPGKKHTILSDVPDHATGERMRQFQVVNGYYVFTSLNKESKKRYVRRFAEACGVEVRFDGAW